MIKLSVVHIMKKNYCIYGNFYSLNPLNNNGLTGKKTTFNLLNKLALELKSYAVSEGGGVEKILAISGSLI